MVVGKDDEIFTRYIEDRAAIPWFVCAGRIRGKEYEAKNIELRSISELVFALLSQFLKHRKKTWKNFGRGLGKLNAARRLLGGGRRVA
jgi:hypothetical protein